MKIRSKLIGYLLFFSVIPLVLVAYLSFTSSKEALTQKTIEQLNTAVVIKEGSLRLWIEAHVDAFRIIHRTMEDFIGQMETVGELHDEVRHNEIEKSFESFLDLYPQFFELFLIDVKTGKVHLSTDPAQLDKIKLDDEYFIQGKEGLHIQTFYYSQVLKQNALTLAMPIEKDGQTVFVFAARVQTDTVNALMAEAGELGKTAETYLVNEYNLFVTQPKHAGYQEFSSAYSFGIEQCLKGQSDFGSYPDYRDVDVIGVYKWIPDSRLCLLAEVDIDEAFLPIYNIQRVIFLIVGVLVLFIFTVGLFFTGSISKPIKRLTDYAEAITKGNLNRKIGEDILDSKDEIGVLGHAYQDMTHKLINSALETKNIIAAMPNGLFVLDEQGIVQIANPAIAHLLSVDEKKLIGRPFYDFIPLKSQKIIDKILSASEKDVNNLEIELKPAKGGLIPVSVSMAPFEIGEDKSGYIVITKDIRELKKYAHERVKKITPILNRISLGDFSQGIDLPEKDDEFSELTIAIDLMADNLKELMDENRTKTEQLEGSQKKLKDSHRYLEKAKRSVDQEKAKTDALIAGIGEGIIVIDLKGNMIFMNPGAEKLFGKSDDKLLGFPYNKYLRFETEKGDEILPDKPPIAKVAKEKRTIFTTTYFVKGKNLRLALATTISPFLFENKLVGIVGTFRDITKEKEVDKAKSEFVSLASHQLRTPLTGIKWLIQVAMKKGGLNKTQKDFLDDALSSNKRMISLVDDLLNVSRLETGTISVNPVRDDVKNLARELINEARPVALKKKIKLKFANPKGKLMAIFDPQLVGQVVTSFLTNAIDYSAEHKAITLSVGKTKTGFTISVKDEGIGISKEDQKSLFTKFFRASEAAKYSTHGSGLGLYIVKKILDVCHGKVKCESTVGKGTTFTVTFPLKMKAHAGLKTLIEEKIS